MMIQQAKNAFEQFMKMGGEEFKVIRNGIEIGTVKGLRNHENSRKYLGFYPETDIKAEDTVIGQVSGDEFYITEVSSSIVGGLVYQKKGYYITKDELNRRNAQQQPIFQIQNANNSIIGTQQNATMTNTFNYGDIYRLIDEHGGEDKVELRQMINEVEQELKENTHVKKGFISKHTDLIAKHSWITSPLAQIAINWFMGKPNS